MARDRAGNCFCMTMTITVLIILALLGQSTCFFSSELHTFVAKMQTLAHEYRKQKIDTLPDDQRQKLFQSQYEDIARALCCLVKGNEGLLKEVHGVYIGHYRQIVLACKRALGDDVAIDVIGSRIRGTAAWQDCDLDLEVWRRSGSKLVKEPFSDIEKSQRMVAANLAKLQFVERLEVGSRAIKFRIGVTNIDLVLWRCRPEEFPNLRGGSSFYENTARINAFLDESPMARAAIIGVKQLFSVGARPKGILIDAIAWRLALAGEIPLSSEAAGDEYCVELFEACLRLARALMSGESSPIFGNDLRRDLSKLPAGWRRQKYMLGFEIVQLKGEAWMQCELLYMYLCWILHKDTRGHLFNLDRATLEQQGCRGQQS